MSSLPPTPSSSAASPSFAVQPPEQTHFNIVPWAIAGVVVLLVVAALVFGGHRKAAPPNSQLPLDPYAPSLVLSNLVMSESTSLSGGKSMYIDGHVHNAGAKTVTDATVQVLFANDEALSPQVETVPLSLIRTREPYIDTQPIANTPLSPGADRDFRLIFEDIQRNWNQQLPAIRAIQISTR